MHSSWHQTSYAGPLLGYARSFPRNTDFCHVFHGCPFSSVNLKRCAATKGIEWNSLRVIWHVLIEGSVSRQKLGRISNSNKRLSAPLTRPKEHLNGMFAFIVN